MLFKYKRISCAALGIAGMIFIPFRYTPQATPRTLVPVNITRRTIYWGTQLNSGKAVEENTNVLHSIPEQSGEPETSNSISETPPSSVFLPDGKKWHPLPVAGSQIQIINGHEVRTVELRGWLRDIASECNPADPDWHYILEIDPAWTDSLGIDLNQLIKIGNIVNVNSANNSPAHRNVSVSAPVIFVELNGWNPNAYYRDALTKSTEEVPSDWQFRNDCSDVIWPYDPRNPLAKQPKLAVGQYVRMVGSIVTDDPHSEIALAPRWFCWNFAWCGSEEQTKINAYRAVLSAWAAGKTVTDPANPARWTEMHPPDTIVVMPQKLQTEAVQVVALFSSNCGLGACASVSLDQDFAPPIPRPSPDAQIGYQLLQGPETNPKRVEESTVDVLDDHIHVRIRVRGESFWGAHGKFKGVIRVFWVTPNPNVAGNRVAVGQNADGRLEVFYIGINDHIYHDWEDSPNGNWHGEAALGGGAKQIAVGRNADGRLEVFYIGTNDQIYHDWQDSAKGNWHGEAALGGEAKQIAVGQNADGRLEIFYIGTNDHIYHNWQDPAKGNWHGEAALGGGAKQIAVGRNTDGRLEIFYIGTDDRLYHN